MLGNQPMLLNQNKILSNQQQNRENIIGSRSISQLGKINGQPPQNVLQNQTNTYVNNLNTIHGNFQGIKGHLNSNGFQGRAQSNPDKTQGGVGGNESKLE